MQEESSPVPTSATQPRGTIAALLILLVAVAAYAFHERNVSKQLVERNSTVTSALNATHDQINALTARPDAMNAERAADKPAPTHPGVYRKPTNGAAVRHRIDDPRWKKMQGQLDDHAKQIDATRQDLTSARTEL